MNKKKVSVIIPCAGHNKKRGINYAKSLIHLASNEYLLERQIRLIRQQYKNPEIIIITGFQSEKIIPIIPKRIKIVENQHFEQTSVVKSIDMGLKVASYDETIIVYGDTVFNSFVLPKLEINSSIVVDTVGQMKDDEVGLNIIDGQAIYFSYGFKPKWANIIYIGKNDIDRFRDMVAAKESKRLFTFEILNKMIDKGCYIECIEPKNMKIIKIDTQKDVEAAQLI